MYFFVIRLLHPYQRFIVHHQATRSAAPSQIWPALPTVVEVHLPWQHCDGLPLWMCSLFHIKPLGHGPKYGQKKSTSDSNNMHFICLPSSLPKTELCILPFWECLLPSSLLINPGVPCQCTTTAPFSMVTWFPGALGFPQSFEPPFPTHDGSEVGKLAVATKMPEENLPNVYLKKKQSTGCQHIIKSTSNPFKMMDTKTDTCYYAIAIPRILWARIIQPVEKKHTEISVRKL